MRYSLTEWEIFLVFFSFLARNGLKFLVSREKSKCEKNGNYSYDPEDYEMWKQIQMSKDDNDLSEKIYNGLETLIQEKISDFPEVN